MRRREFLRAGVAGGAWAMTTGGVWAFGGGQAEAGRQSAQPPANGAKPLRVLVWSEGTAPKTVYPSDIRGAVADALKGLRNVQVQTATIGDADQGVSQATLDATDVLFWWGHLKHGDITDETVARIEKRVKEGGMGFVGLHSAHYAKPFQKIVGASGAWKEYVEDGAPQRIRVADAKHPVAWDVPREFVIPKEERYEEPFVVPAPDIVVFGGFYESTKTDARQGMAWTRLGKGRVFYFRPGHETFPVYFQPEVKRILRNVALWAGGDNGARIREDADPAAKAARSAGEPPLAEIAQTLGYNAAAITASGEIVAPRFVRADPKKPVQFEPVAAFGVLQTLTAGFHDAANAQNKQTLWTIEAKRNKEYHPPVARGGKTTFTPPGGEPFGLWVATSGFAGETIFQDDALQAANKRFGSVPRRKAHVYPVGRDAYLIGWEYSTNDDNQDLVTLVANVRPAP